MKEVKVLTAVLLCLGIAGMASAIEVINIDLNGDVNDPYSGYAAFDGGTDIWLAYYQEPWGKAVGSPRTAGLADYNEPNTPSTYAAQVWIGDDANVAHGYLTGSGTGLMDDGFVKTGGPEDPNPGIRLWGRDAYEGTFDIYVYGANDGNFTLTCPLRDPNVETKHVDGWSSPGFIPGKNYVVFEDVNVSDPNYVTLNYDNVLNGIQLVKPQLPVAIYDDVQMEATLYDVAYETNQRSGESAQFGPDIGVDGETSAIFYLDAGEYMEYDITVDEANEGQYQIDALVNTENGPASVAVSIDGIEFGDLIYEDFYTTIGCEGGGGSGECPYDWTRHNPGDGTEASFVMANLFEGSHTFRWKANNLQGANLARFRFNYIGPPIMNDCNDVYLYNYNYAGDYTGDCHVDLMDLKLVTDHWLECYSPDPNDCL